MRGPLTAGSLRIVEGRVNAELARVAIEASTQCDLAALQRIYASEVVGHVAGAHPLAGEYRGRNALLSYVELSHDMTGGTLHLELETVLATDRHCGAFVRATAERKAADSMS